MLKILGFIPVLSNDGKRHCIAELSVASSSELATELDDYIFEEGSTAWDISTGDMYGLAGGTWYEQNATPETPDTPENNAETEPPAETQEGD